MNNFSAFNFFQKRKAQILSAYGFESTQIQKSESENDLEKSEDFEETFEISDSINIEEKIENIERLNLQILSALNNQIRNEFQSSFMYRETSAWLDDKGWIDGSRLFFKYADEELDHAKKIYKYIFEKNCKAITPSDLGSITLSYSNIKDVISSALNHEIKITTDWNDIASLAKSINDHDTYNLALSFISEQTEEEEKFRNILFKINLDMPNYEIDELFADLLEKSENLDLSKSEDKETDNIISYDDNGDPIYAKEFNPGKQDFVELVKSEENSEDKKDEQLEKSKEDPCWDGYEMIGMKDKDGKKVPNCVPVEKSEDNDLEKGRKGVPVGTVSKNGRYVKTNNGWEVNKKESGNKEKLGSSSYGQFKDMSHEDLSKLNKLAKQAKEKNGKGEKLTKEEQHALDNHADIESELDKKNQSNKEIYSKGDKVIVGKYKMTVSGYTEDGRIKVVNAQNERFTLSKKQTEELDQKQSDLANREMRRK